MEHSKYETIMELLDSLEESLKQQQEGLYGKEFEIVIKRLEDMIPEKMPDGISDESKKMLDSLYSAMDIDYRQFYDYIVSEEERLKSLDVIYDYRVCKALAACYELQEYLANRIAELGLVDETDC